MASGVRKTRTTQERMIEMIKKTDISKGVEMPVWNNRPQRCKEKDF